MPMDVIDTPLQKDLPALTKWSDEYLVSALGDRKVSVAGTSDGHVLRSSYIRNPSHSLVLISGDQTRYAHSQIVPGVLQSCTENT